jgi:hypothetical protein
MKPLPAPNVPGKTEFERFDNDASSALCIEGKLLNREEKERKDKGQPRK